jgi:hypothetical protein
MNRIKVSLVTLAVLTGALVIGGCLLNNHSEFSEEFGIYLLENGELVFSDKDIVTYNKSSHEIKLTEEGVEKIKALKVPVAGRPFVIRLNGDEIYNGSFVNPSSSISYSGIAIVTFIQNNGVTIDLGYPNSEFFEGVDPRNHSEIFDYLQKVGKLID